MGEGEGEGEGVGKGQGEGEGQGVGESRDTAQWISNAVRTLRRPRNDYDSYMHIGLNVTPSGTRSAYGREANCTFG